MAIGYTDFAMGVHPPALLPFTFFLTVSVLIPCHYFVLPFPFPCPNFYSTSAFTVKLYLARFNAKITYFLVRNTKRSLFAENVTAPAERNA